MNAHEGTNTFLGIDSIDFLSTFHHLNNLPEFSSEVLIDSCLLSSHKLFKLFCIFSADFSTGIIIIGRLGVDEIKSKFSCKVISCEKLSSNIIHCLSSIEFSGPTKFPLTNQKHNSNNIGTLIKKEEKNMEGALISGIAFTKDESEIIIKGVKDQPGVASKILGPIGDANIEVDMIVQNVGSDGLADFTFTVSRNSLNKAVKVIEKYKKSMGYQNIESKRNIVKVSLVGVGMRSHAGIASKMFKCLAKNKVNIRMISTSEIKISVVIDQKNLEIAVQALHNEFKLEKKNN